MCAGQSYRERVELYLHRASASSKGSEEQKKYAKLALAEMDSLDELANTATEDAAPEDSQGLYLLKCCMGGRQS